MSASAPDDLVSVRVSALIRANTLARFLPVRSQLLRANRRARLPQCRRIELQESPGAQLLAQGVEMGELGAGDAGEDRCLGCIGRPLAAGPRVLMDLEARTAF